MKKANLQIHKILRGQQGIAHHIKIREEEDINTKTQENQKYPEALAEEIGRASCRERV